MLVGRYRGRVGDLLDEMGYEPLGGGQSVDCSWVGNASSR